MRAMTIDTTGAPDVLVETELERPVRVNSEVLVRVVAAGVNPIDSKTRSGRGVSSAITAWPAVLGYDFSGVVVEAPYEAHPLQPGTEVFGMTSVPRSGGSYAEFVAVSTLSVARKPRTISHVEAAGIPLAALTAWGLVVDVAKAHEGQRMLVHAGAGGVGHFAVQLASYFGARVTATGSASSLDFLRSLGAAEAVDYSAVRFEDVVGTMDAVIDLIGNVHDDTGTRSLGVLRPDGLIVNGPTGSWPTFAEDAAAAGVRATTYKVAPDASTLSVIARLIDSGDVRVTVDSVFDLCDAAKAHTAIDEGHTRGKIVLRVSES
ncbi:NADP-dependent oxidoreductase [Marisediminicola sp. LYQ134]|uniref:NADP-dependent oxidoreductase n=1 Tax=Marisediminicola sp. LYQ134 TaxID=3391061 RepID=UPI003983CA67